MKYFTLLDRYIMKKFLSTFFVAIMLIIAIIMVFDLTEKMSNFIENNVSTREIVVDYYLSFIPYYANLFMSLFVFISIIFFTSKLAGKSEIIAMLSNGVSFWRLLFPYFAVAFMLASLSFLLGAYVIPPANKTRIAFEDKYVYYRPNTSVYDIHKQVKEGVFVYLHFFDNENNIGHVMTIEQFEGTELVSKMYSDNIVWSEEEQTWKANNYWIRNYGDKEDELLKGKSIDTNIVIVPSDLKETVVNISTLNLSELNDFIEEQKLHGNENINEFLLEKHKRYALPFSMFVLTFIGVAMSSKKVRGGTGINIGIGLVLCFAYILFQKIADQWAINGSMSPLLSVWIPNFIFTFISIFLYRLAPK